MPGEQRTEEHVQAELAEVDSALARQEGGEEPQESQQTQGEDPAVEREAMKHGWVPRDRFRGDQSTWKPASAYLEDGLKFNKTMKRKLQQLEANYAELERTGQAFAKFHEEAMARKDQELKDSIAETKRRARVAAREGDDDLADTLDARVELLEEERQTLKKQEPVTAPKARALKEDGSANTDDPLVEEWVNDGNEWFRDNAKLRAYSTTLAAEIIREEYGGDLPASMRGRKFLDLVSQRMAEEFPRQFQKKPEPAAKRADQVGTGGVRSSSSGGEYSVNDLPAADLALMKEFIAKGWTTKEKFLKDYFQPGKRIHRSS